MRESNKYRNRWFTTTKGYDVKVLEPGSLQRMVLMIVLFGGLGLAEGLWLTHGHTLPIAIPLWFAIICFSIAFTIRIKELEKENSELRRQLTAKAS